MTTNATSVAEAIATKAHAGQVDKGGADYIGHPRRIAAKVQEIPGFTTLSQAEQISAVEAAWLHDVIEDTDITEAELSEAGISDLAIEIVDLLTRNSENPARDGDAYYLNVKAHPVARLVKIADIADNSNHSRKAQMIANGKSVKPGKYEHALAMLELTADEQDWFDKDIQVVVH